MISINRASKGSTIKLRDLYLRTNGIAPNINFNQNIPTYVRSFNGESIKLNKVKNVFLSGIKETWRFKFNKSGTVYLRATPSHKFLTARGFIKGRELKSGDKIAFDYKWPKKSQKKRKKIRDSYFSKIRLHPYATKCNSDRRIVYHRAVYEAHINGLSLIEYLRIIRGLDKIKRKLKYIDPSKWHVHHKDGNHKNNKIENLKLMTCKEHYKLHGDHRNFNQGKRHWKKYYGYDRIGVESVYDIEVEGSHLNFVANNLVVHNSGKTTLMANLAMDFVLNKVPAFIGSIETGATDLVKRLISALASKDYNSGDAVPLDELKYFYEKHAHKFLNDKLFLSLYEDRFPVDILKQDISTLVEREGIKIAIVDNLNFFLEGCAHDIKIMDKVVHDLIIFVKNTPVHLIMVMHPRKTVNGRVESEFDIKGSATAVQEAQNVWLWNNIPDNLLKDNTYSHSDRELKIAKMRRKGKYVGSRLVFGSVDGVRYWEKGIY